MGPPLHCLCITVTEEHSLLATVAERKCQKKLIWGTAFACGIVFSSL